jgi:hypothetical protein
MVELRSSMLGPPTADVGLVDQLVLQVAAVVLQRRPAVADGGRDVAADRLDAAADHVGGVAGGERGRQQGVDLQLLVARQRQFGFLAGGQQVGDPAQAGADLGPAAGTQARPGVGGEGLLDPGRFGGERLGRHRLVAQQGTGGCGGAGPQQHGQQWGNDRGWWCCWAAHRRPPGWLGPIIRITP